VADITRPVHGRACLPCEVNVVAEKITPKQHNVYEQIHAGDDFQELRKRYRAFAIPWTVAFMVWYLLYVLASSFATDLMSTRLVGNINVALVFGLLQFVSTFGIAWLYSRHANKEAQYDEEVGR
jgi:uncharacterized membrane protein (DUF485 family)